jgi:hypothetical protein
MQHHNFSAETSYHVSLRIFITYCSPWHDFFVFPEHSFATPYLMFRVKRPCVGGNLTLDTILQFRQFRLYFFFACHSYAERGT